MTLELTVLRCPDAVAPEMRTVTGGEYSVGRGPGVDWVLPDGDRTLSKRHFALAFRSGAWQLADTSTNGTFMNAEADPVGAGDVRTLRDGDRIRLGAYEIEARLPDDAQAFGGGFGGAARGSDPFGDPFGMDPMAPPPRAHQPFGESAPPRAEAPPILPEDDFLLGADPFGQPRSGSFQNSVQSDHSSVMEDAFQPPREIGRIATQTEGIIPGNDLLSDDWDSILDGIGGTTPAPSPATPKPAPPPPVQPRHVAPTPPPPIAPAPVSTDVSPFDEPADIIGGPHRLEQHAPPAAVTRAAPPVYEPPARLAAPQAAAPQAAAPQAAAPQARPLPVATGDLLAAFLQGAGLPNTTMADPEATMRGLGAAFRATVSGLREVLIARREIKSEFRIEQTMMRARGNNPLKFSLDDDDALSALLGSGRRVDMAPATAVADALKDIRLHELASLNAMQTAVRALMDGLDPGKLRETADKSGGITVLPAQRKARAWDAFEALHNKTNQALRDDFDSVFGKAFARAYERAMDELSVKERE